MEMTSSESVMQFASSVKKLAPRMKAMAAVIDDKKMAMGVLNGLPARFCSFIVPIDAFGNEQKKVGLNYVRSRLVQEVQPSSMLEPVLLRFCGQH